MVRETTGLLEKVIGEQIAEKVLRHVSFRRQPTAREIRMQRSWNRAVRYLQQQPVLLKRRCGRGNGRELDPDDGRFASRGQPHLYIEADAGERDSAESDHFPGG